MLTFAHIPTGPTTNRNRFISGRKSDNLSPAAARIARIQASRPRRDSLLTPPSRCPNIGVHLNLLRRVLGRAGVGWSTLFRRRDRGLCVVLLLLSTSVLTGTVERHISQAFSCRVRLSGSRAGGTRQSGSPGRGPQVASQTPCSARTASRSHHRSS